MNINPAFRNMVQAAGGQASQIQNFALEANSLSEQHMPEVAKAMADHFSFINEPHTPDEVDAAKAKMLQVQERHPETFESLADLGEEACPESVMMSYAQGTESSMFSVQVHEFGLFNNPPTIAGEKTGTLFVDTTPGQDGLQYAFVPLQPEPKFSDPQDAWAASLGRESESRDSGGERLVYENLACAVYRSADGTYNIV